MQATQPKNQSSNTATGARICALFSLVHTLDKNQPFDTCWKNDSDYASLSHSDRAFAQLLAKTTLRRLGQIDALLEPYLKNTPAPRAMHCLRLGVTQLVFLDTPAHAAVHSTVEMSKKVKSEKFSGLINAVLKKVSNEGKVQAEKQDIRKLNTPKWMWQAWKKAYGEETARAIASAHLQDPPLDITVKSDAKEWAEKLEGKLIPCDTIRLKGSRNITKLDGFSEGRWWVQDIAASIPARLLGDISGKNIVDICAAPGGKTAQLAAAGANVIAVDISKQRITILDENMKRLGFSVNSVVCDALKWQPETTPDAILLDAPCSATGTLRRHPDVAWHRTPSDIARLQISQYKLLNRALDMLSHGRILIYSVCSLQPEEGEMQITRLLNGRKDVKLLPVLASEIGGLDETLTDRGEVRTLPCHITEHGGMDGFYAARLEKK